MSLPNPDCFNARACLRLGNFSCNRMSHRSKSKSGDGWKKRQFFSSGYFCGMVEQSKEKCLEEVELMFLICEILPAMKLSVVLIHLELTPRIASIKR